MKLTKHLETGSKKIVEAAAFLLFGLVTILGAVKSAYLENAYEQKITIAGDSILLNLLFLAVLFFLMKVIADVVEADLLRRRRLLLFVVLGVVFAVSFVWAVFSKCFPTADQASVYYAAKHFAVDYYEEIAEKASYFSCYPHQMGLALFYEILFRIFHTDSFHLLQGVNAVLNVISILSLYKITDLLFEEKRVSIYFLLISVLCVPLFWYTPFVYSDLPSLAFLFLGVWMLLAALSGRTKGGGRFAMAVLSLLVCTAACAVRKNTFIAIIGIVLTMLVYIIRSSRYEYLPYLLLLSICAVSVIPLIQRSYELRSGGRLNDGVPSISHAVMGLQESNYAPGWYNGYNFETYAYEADYDQERAREISRQDLQKRLEEFRENPGYTYVFFRDKFTAEWLNTGYACIDYTAGKYYERLPFIESFFSGSMFYGMRFFMDKYQFFVYAMGFVFTGSVLFGKKNPSTGIWGYCLLATIVGGALFYLVWEGNGRYILPYFVMTLPYAAAGMLHLEKAVWGWLRGKKKQS